MFDASSLPDLCDAVAAPCGGSRVAGRGWPRFSKMGGFPCRHFDVTEVGRSGWDRPWRLEILWGDAGVIAMALPVLNSKVALIVLWQLGAILQSIGNCIHVKNRKIESNRIFF